MAQILALTDANWQEKVGNQPALLLLTTGEGLRGDFATAFRKAAAENQRVIFAQIDPSANPILVEKFGVLDKPVLVGWLGSEEVVRRVRPWGTDVVLTIELLEKKYQEMLPAAPQTAAALATNGKGKTIMDSKPFVVTDMTFQAEVVDFSQDTPVLVDFWAEWCGPCKMVAPIMEKLAAEFAGQVRIAKVDTDSNPGLSQAFRIMSIPTIMAFKQGQLVFNQAGAFPEPAFRDLVQQLIALKIPAQNEPADQPNN